MVTAVRGAAVPVCDLPGSGRLAAAVRSGVRLSYVRERIGTAAVSLAASALREAGVGDVVVDLGRLAEEMRVPPDRVVDAAFQARACAIVPPPAPVPMMMMS